MMFTISMEPNGLRWEYHPPGECAPPCPGDCIHVNAEAHHLSADDHVALVKATKLICGVFVAQAQNEMRVLKVS